MLQLLFRHCKLGFVRFRPFPMIFCMFLSVFNRCLMIMLMMSMSKVVDDDPSETLKPQTWKCNLPCHTTVIFEGELGGGLGTLYLIYHSHLLRYSLKLDEKKVPLSGLNAFFGFMFNDMIVPVNGLRNEEKNMEEQQPACDMQTLLTIAWPFRPEVSFFFVGQIFNVVWEDWFADSIEIIINNRHELNATHVHTGFLEITGLSSTCQ